MKIFRHLGFAALAILWLCSTTVAANPDASPPDRQAKKAQILQMMGSVPSVCEQHQGEKIAEEIIKVSVTGIVKRVTLRSCGDNLYLLEAIPHRANATTPMVLALHQTTAHGKDEVMGFAGDSKLAYGDSFFKAGYVVIAPDVFIAGEHYDSARDWDTSSFYKTFPDWSALGRMLADHLAVMRYIASSRQPNCIAAVGHSLGGHNALFLAAFAPSIDVTITSGGFERMATDLEATRWSRDKGFIYMPSLRDYVTAPAPRKLPWDMVDVLQLIAPRSVLVIQGAKDPSWTFPESVIPVIANANAPYEESLDVPVHAILHAGGHEFGPELQQYAIEFVKTECAKRHHEQ